MEDVVASDDALELEGELGALLAAELEAVPAAAAEEPAAPGCGAAAVSRDSVLRLSDDVAEEC